MIGSVAEFARYWDGVRRRTWAAVDRVGPEPLDWAPRPGEMTCGEIVRHLAGAERFLVEHEVHHRSQLDCYLALAGVEPPQIFGRRMEDVLAQVAGGTAGSTGGPR